MKVRYDGKFAHFTDRGKVRVSNEDRSNVLTNERGDVLLLVCDGMGGQNKGDYASQLASDMISESFLGAKRPNSHWLSKAIKKANKRIYQESLDSPNFSDMGTTCVAVLILGGKMVIANAGDSRAYCYSRETGLVRLTRDQTYVDYLARTGRIKESEVATHPERHILMNALGIYATCSLEIETKAYKGETILLCSDGLYNNLSEVEIASILHTDDRVDQKARMLIIGANNNGGSDNIGISLWEAITND